MPNQAPKTKWPGVIAGGLLAGVVINAGELALHRVVLQERWTAAFAALGKHPTGWTTFIPANFLVGFFVVWLYARLRSRYGAGSWTAFRAGLAMWMVFWVIPILALVPLELFPNQLLFLVIAGGVVNANLAALLGAWMCVRLEGTGESH
ncbi:MAG TPA: hypothetical protein VNL17_11425 [Verrucomicrobiae bacterium]|nr:hypothetical protein [Verrucomicrobiae bacterium]